MVGEVALLVGQPNSSPLSFYPNAFLKTVAVSIESGGGDLRYIAQPRATFGTAPGIEFQLDGWVKYSLLPSNGLPVIHLNQDGSFDALRAGRATVRVQFEDAAYNVGIVVEPPMHE
jgi:hypothetical protein